MAKSFQKQIFPLKSEIDSIPNIFVNHRMSWKDSGTDGRFLRHFANFVTFFVLLAVPGLKTMVAI
jgi:hypothetical protein